MKDRKSTRLNSSHYLHDALPISSCDLRVGARGGAHLRARLRPRVLLQTVKLLRSFAVCDERSEEHTSELQSLPTRRSSDLFLRSSRGSPGRRPPSCSSSAACITADGETAEVVRRVR